MLFSAFLQLRTLPISSTLLFLSTSEFYFIYCFANDLQGCTVKYRTPFQNRVSTFSLLSVQAISVHLFLTITWRWCLPQIDMYRTLILRVKSIIGQRIFSLIEISIELYLRLIFCPQLKSFYIIFCISIRNAWISSIVLLYAPAWLEIRNWNCDAYTRITLTFLDHGNIPIFIHFSLHRLRPAKHTHTHSHKHTHRLYIYTK